MPFIDHEPQLHAGKAMGNGHCVALLQLGGAKVPHTSRWRPGGDVLGNYDLVPGTAIATFDSDGRYGNHTDGRSHAALFLRHDQAGFWVVDQWVGHPVAPRLIRDKQGQGLACDDASRYDVIEAQQAVA